jgi:hypothetical protein
VSDSDHIEAVLQRLLQERAELDTVIALLQKRMGKAVADSTSPIPPAKPLLNASPGGSAASVVYRGAFFNLSVTKAAEKLLRTFGRPLKTPEILSAFQQAEYEMAKGDNARSGIYTALARSKDFVKVLPDTWDLAERHPEAALKKAEELAAKTAKPKKAKKASKTAAPKAELKPTMVSEAKVA